MTPVCALKNSNRSDPATVESVYDVTDGRIVVHPKSQSRGVDEQELSGDANLELSVNIEQFL